MFIYNQQNKFTREKNTINYILYENVQYVDSIITVINNNLVNGNNGV